MAEDALGRPISEQVFEIRYRPNAKILDYRGTWAELISNQMALSEWRILENRVDIFDKESKNHCFVGFRNSGYVTRDAPTGNYFQDQAIKFFRYVMALEGFGKEIFVERIGVRGKFVTPHPGSIEELLKRYTERYLRLTEAADQAIAAKLLDIGGNLNFADKYGNFNTASGPMPKEQIQQFFDWKDELPNLGLFYDIDYWLKPKKDLPDGEILRLIGVFAKEGWERHERIRSLILGQ